MDTMLEHELPRCSGAGLCLILAFGAVSSLSANAAEPDWPEAWFEPARTASQFGIDSFSQSPLLEGQGLPPVERRLPDDPVVVVPLESVGVYGGTARIIADDRTMFISPEGLFTISPDHKTILPNLAESWTYSEGGRRLTVRLRRGLKWSDGQPMSADDVLFAVNDLQLNSGFMPVTLPDFIGLRLHAVDPWTLVFDFPEPDPFFVNYVAQSPELFLMPKHYFRDFHPDYATAEEIDARMEEMGFSSWSAFMMTSMQMRLFPDLVNQPTLRAFQIESLTPDLYTYSRNPYYFKIDPDGRQLPYIDAVEAQDVRENEVAVAKASTGQLDFAGVRLPTQDIPLLKLGERNSGIKVNIWNRLHGSDLSIQANMNYADERKRALFNDVRFRRALSMAINRDEMNEIIYFGRGTPRQVTVIPESDYFEPEFATAWARFDVDAANALLDEIGLVDIDGDGMRELPDGERLTLTVEYVDTETPKQVSMELVTSYWNAVGIDARQRLIDRELQYSRAIAGELEMTVWHADRTTDILFPINPDFWAPRKLAASLAMWSEWSRWYLTGGDLGEEPPPDIRRLQLWADELATTMDSERRVELGKRILAANAENVWTIGTVGLAPQPVVTSNRLRNVVESGLWGWDTRYTMAYHPATWYLDQ
ncbi:MAG: ABC transporter substrate-binding protein [Gammaproteobacteria bacterium]|nr:ABC transporter substrate-binding protein [Gammaproteobacteria bacterium]MYH84713.1 ABC transporter substrate-binding protein [Gammaproteobacteria bacterium]MYK06103.1 ABC transporter substrate-binding protein [Gammaproteobacteria bacterium]